MTNSILERLAKYPLSEKLSVLLLIGALFIQFGTMIYFRFSPLMQEQDAIRAFEIPVGEVTDKAANLRKALDLIKTSTSKDANAITTAFSGRDWTTNEVIRHLTGDRNIKLNTKKDRLAAINKLLPVIAESQPEETQPTPPPKSESNSPAPAPAPIVDPKKTKEQADAWNKLADAQERAKSLGIDTSSLVAVDSSEVKDIDSVTESLNKLIAAKERAYKIDT